MAIDGDERSELEELEARVYSRAGADEPRAERVDPMTGRTISVTESEWRLLEAQRDRVARADRLAREVVDAGTAGIAGDGDPEAVRSGTHSAPPVASAAARTDRRRARDLLASAAVGMLAGGALVAGWFVLGDAVQEEPTVEAVVTPTPFPELLGAEQVPGGAAFDVFRDIGLRGGTLPAGLDEFFPAERVARLLRQEGPIRGTDVYAAVSYDDLACLIVRLDPNGIVANCTSVERVRRGGLTLRAAIPSGIGSGRDPDGDGVAGDAARTDLLVVGWQADGTFRITRNPD
jgi:hypothetical protein